MKNTMNTTKKEVKVGLIGVGTPIGINSKGFSPD